ncbi:hypothetical protein VFPPC_17416 [Pochonia chlamydosporia 170]|uniref:Uncharacterized protein n=1 Tax=Pochonia chlamydosporia 170 TaxID=1380566 RepID=A0A219ATC3_METCM|nr:hypothetical protein VFPPC_17416 [Pochonia chlamydosporia 170]OWT43435.1 hypothetical protein VFPPC_17416 [Pochonia chlamydosporia 170]
MFETLMLERDKMLAPHLMMHAKDFIAGRQRAGVGPHSSFPFHFRLKSTITDIAASIKPKDYTVFWTSGHTQMKVAVKSVPKALVTAMDVWCCRYKIADIKFKFSMDPSQTRQGTG